MYLSSGDLQLVLDHGENQTVGMRFSDVEIPQGAVVYNAYIQFQVSKKKSVVTTLTVEGEDIDHASTFSSTAPYISSRSRTSAAVSWSPAAWTTVGASGPDQQTPEIAPIIQEIVDRPGWSKGNSLVLIVTGTGQRVAESYDGNPDGAPMLHVEYATPDITRILGDMDVNGLVDFDDIDDFAEGLKDPVAYQATHGVPSSLIGDMDGDGDHDFDDIGPFAALLKAAGSAESTSELAVPPDGNGDHATIWFVASPASEDISSQFGGTQVESQPTTEPLASSDDDQKTDPSQAPASVVASQKTNHDSRKAASEQDLAEIWSGDDDWLALAVSDLGLSGRGNHV